MSGYKYFPDSLHDLLPPRARRPRHDNFGLFFSSPSPSLLLFRIVARFSKPFVSLLEVSRTMREGNKIIKKKFIGRKGNLLLERRRFVLCPCLDRGVNRGTSPVPWMFKVNSYRTTPCDVNFPRVARIYIFSPSPLSPLTLCVCSWAYKRRITLCVCVCVGTSRVKYKFSRDGELMGKVSDCKRNAAAN